MNNLRNIEGRVSLMSKKYPIFGGKWSNGTWNSNAEPGTKGNLLFSGVFENGTWNNGIWLDGHWRGGRWLDGTWKKGEIYSNKFNKYIPSLINPKEFYKIERDNKVATEPIFFKKINAGFKSSAGKC